MEFREFGLQSYFGCRIVSGCRATCRVGFGCSFGVPEVPGSLGLLAMGGPAVCKGDFGARINAETPISLN